MKASSIRCVALAICASGASALAGIEPANQCAQAPDAPAGLYPFDTRGQTPDGSSSCGFSANSPDVWLWYTAARDGNAIITTCGSTFDTVLTAYAGCGGAEIACNDDACDVQSRIVVAVTAGQRILLRIAGSFGETGAGVIDIRDPEVPPVGTWLESVNGDAGDLPPTAQPVPDGVGYMPRINGFYSGVDADMYVITICDPQHFTATTCNDETMVDTQLWLFTEDGRGVVFNDDNTTPGEGPQSCITPLYVHTLPAGRYYLAVTGFNRDPLDSGGAFLWRDGPYRVERRPDGPGRLNPIASWVGSNYITGPYRIDLTGVCRGGLCPWTPVGCIADFNGSGGTPDDADIDMFFQYWNAGEECADSNGSGMTPDDADVDLFFQLWNNGGC